MNGVNICSKWRQSICKKIHEFFTEKNPRNRDLWDFLVTPAQNVVADLFNPIVSKLCTY
jgi:hypothetical protein